MPVARAVLRGEHSVFAVRGRHHGVSIYSLDTFSKEGAVRISVEVLVVFALVTAAYLLVLEPVLRSVAPTVYAQPGLDYSRTDLPSTASEVTHLLLSVVVGGIHLFWRLSYTELGEAFGDAVMEDR
jgi:hypothetical protein